MSFSTLAGVVLDPGSVGGRRRVPRQGQVAPGKRRNLGKSVRDLVGVRGWWHQARSRTLSVTTFLFNHPNGSLNGRARGYY